MSSVGVGQREAGSARSGEASPRAFASDDFGGLWWMFLISGVLWFLIAIIVLRFNLTSLTAIGALVGAFVLLAGLNELATTALVRDWRWLHAGLAALFVAVGIVALFHPTHTFWVVAWLFSFYLLFKGVFDITISLLERSAFAGWWLRLLVGILEVGIAFWASGDYYATGSLDRRAILLVAWVGFGALFRGITEIVLALAVRSQRKETPAQPLRIATDS